MSTSTMGKLWEKIEAEPRLLVEARLRPVQGERFQPAGFPDLGAATFMLPDRETVVLVESPQSMANRLEAVTWDDARGDLVEELQGLPYVRARVEDERGELLAITASVLEAHRLNSPYIIGDEGFHSRLREAAGIPQRRQRARGGQTEEEVGIGTVDRRKLAWAVFQYDPCSLLHGVFLEKLDGRARLTRALSAFIEARGAQPAVSGGVKNDRIDPSGNTEQGYGNVPFSRVEYVARDIVAYFNLDLGLLRSYGLPDEAYRLLVALGLWKIDRFLKSGLRLRTACDLDLVDVVTTRPEGVALPDSDAVAAELRRLIGRCKRYFADPPVTEVRVRYTRTRRGEATTE